jgi:hypothetical protein
VVPPVIVELEPPEAQPTQLAKTPETRSATSASDDRGVVERLVRKFPSSARKAGKRPREEGAAEDEQGHLLTAFGALREHADNAFS